MLKPNKEITGGELGSNGLKKFWLKQRHLHEICRQAVPAACWGRVVLQSGVRCLLSPGHWESSVAGEAATIAWHQQNVVNNQAVPLLVTTAVHYVPRSPAAVVEGIAMGQGQAE